MAPLVETTPETTEAETGGGSSWAMPSSESTPAHAHDHEGDEDAAADNDHER
jgi:hypothetical protein